MNQVKQYFSQKSILKSRGLFPSQIHDPAYLNYEETPGNGKERLRKTYTRCEVVQLPSPLNKQTL